MEKTAFAVIGSNWGDEGKGLAVDAITRQLIAAGDQVLVVRSNGGAQAGHGVELPGSAAQKVRHVFSHIGAGALAGAATHLSRYFVASPMLFGREYEQILELGGCLEITIDPAARVTTPWDIALNQAAENARGSGRHGSCGMGFGETIEREEAGFGLSVADLEKGQKHLLTKLDLIKDFWVKERARNIGFGELPPLLKMTVTNPMIRERFLDDCDKFLSRVRLLSDRDILASGRSVLFEGAQGLQLDMSYGTMPHVTRSHTGIRNMLSISAAAGIDEIRATYVTRAYATRHGAGPLPHETFDGHGGTEPLKWADVVDLTNGKNDWQGDIRQAPLDLDLLADAIQSDLSLAHKQEIKVTPFLGVTCIDQIVDSGELIRFGHKICPKPNIVPWSIAMHVGIPVGMVSHGPTFAAVSFPLNRIEGTSLFLWQSNLKEMKSDDFQPCT